MHSCWPSTLKTILVPALLLSSAPVHAAPPTAYSATYVNGLLGIPMKVEFQRDGNRALVEQSTAPTPENPAGWVQRNLVDFALSSTWTLPVNPGDKCSVARTQGDSADVFDSYTEVMKLLAPSNPKRLGTETVNGFPTQILEATDVIGLGPGKLWVDEKDGLLVRWIAKPAGGPEKLIWELKSITRARPPASLFVLPAACSNLPVPVSPEQEIANDTGGRLGQYLDAKIGPATKDRCHVLFKVVQKPALQPVTSGFQVAVDTSIEPPGAEYHTDMDQEGIAKFTGGHVREMTNMLKNGSLRILNPPESFLISVNFPHGYDVDGPVFRRCFGPETTLLLLVDETRKPLHWLWVTTPH